MIESHDDRPIAICFGTRPQTIKASVLVPALRERFPVVAIDTGQHYDYEVNALLFEQLHVSPPDVCLEVGSADHATQTARILERAAELFARLAPRAVVVIGDTNSTLGGALAAAKMRIPVVHVEAGVRAKDALLAEEINRRAVDVMSAVLCAPTARAASRLHAEQVPGRTCVTGDVAYDVLRRHLARAVAPGAAGEWPLAPNEPFLLSTFHRAELTGQPAVLVAVLDALARSGLPVVLAAHPRLRAVLDATTYRPPSHVHVVPPLGYFETIGAVCAASAVVTDSGGLQREAYWLETPCVTVRDETEWEETIELGANVLVPPDQAERLAATARTAVERKSRGQGWDTTAYGDGSAAGKIADSIP
jgi:UDP-GlcNAc3NAcA epimerase